MSCVDEIFRAYAERGDAFYGERVTQLDHALQCAALAEADGAPDALIAAALLHDYGHLFEGRGDAAQGERRDARHEVHGALALKAWFGPAVVAPIALHVAAKRHLCAAQPGYEAALSPASVLSLKLQGGRFTRTQCRRFGARPFAGDAIQVRRWDDGGKLAGLATPGLEHYRPLLERLTARPGRS
ncbi:MAG: HD domain-containing protein [Caulobacterales bacterium]